MIIPDNSIPLPITTLMVQISGMFNPNRRWTDYEIGLLAEICRHETCFEECERIVKFRAKLPSGSKMFPMSVSRLLENWTSVLDRSDVMAKPKGVLKDRAEINRRNIAARMAKLEGQAKNHETGEWLTDFQSLKDREEYNQLKQQIL